MKQDITKYLNCLSQENNAISLAAHKEAAPYRKTQANYSNPKISAVLVPLVFHQNQWQIIMIIRPKYDGHHSGQIAFPGGKAEPQDHSTKETALRETHEEIGLQPSTFEVPATLSEVYIPVSNYLIYPYVGFSESFNQNQLKLDPTEVEDVIFIPVNWLLNTTLKNIQVTGSGGMKFKAPAFVYDKHTIWGASCMMLNELKHRLSTS